MTSQLPCMRLVVGDLRPAQARGQEGLLISMWDAGDGASSTGCNGVTEGCGGREKGSGVYSVLENVCGVMLWRWVNR
jgi:hypothetical protein